MKSTKTVNTDTARALVERARTVTGYRSQVNRESVFGREVGYPGSNWNGSFLHELLREEGVLETAFISTTGALAYYVRRNRGFQENPAPGDVVFYAFGSTGPFEQPHVGLVTDTAHFAETGEFSAIEGETASGLSRGTQDRDGVFERARTQADVLLFVRPRAPEQSSLVNLPQEKDLPLVRPSNFSKRSTIRARSTAALQYALFELTGFDRFIRGEWDGLTRSVFEQALRNLGSYESVSDIPTEEQLDLVGTATLNRHYRVS